MFPSQARVLCRHWKYFNTTFLSLQTRKKKSGEHTPGITHLLRNETHDYKASMMTEDQRSKLTKETFCCLFVLKALCIQYECTEKISREEVKAQMGWKPALGLILSRSQSAHGVTLNGRLAGFAGLRSGSGSKWACLAGKRSMCCFSNGLALSFHCPSSLVYYSLPLLGATTA